MIKMPRRIPCKNCGVKILPKTAEITGGICMPCSRKSEFEEASHIADDDWILSVPMCLAASRASYLGEVFLDQACAAAEVLSEQGLTSVDLRQRYESNPEDFHLSAADLNDAGLLLEAEIRHWRNSIDCGNDSRIPTLSDFKRMLRCTLGDFDPDGQV